MAKQYEESLVQALKDRQALEDYHGAPLLVKNLPDCDEKGAMDPRLYRDQKKALRMMAWMPSFMMKMDTSEKGIANLRQMFNGLKSVPCVDAPIDIEKRTVKAEDGYEIPIRIYRKPDAQNVPKGIFYYIHGGGFFGGSPDVVEESVKMFVAKTGMVTVSVDYRLAPENPYPAGHQDCYRVCQWIGDNGEFGEKAHNIFVAGDSAGGNLTQYCSTRDWEDGRHYVKGQLLLYPTVNMAMVEDEYYNEGMKKFDMAPKQKRGLSKMLAMFAGMSSGLEPILKVKDVKNDYLNPYTRDPSKNPPTFLTVGEHDFLKMETLGYGVKLHKAGVETKMLLYKGFGHAYFDNTGVYPQTEDCVDEMAAFVLSHCQA